MKADEAFAKLCPNVNVTTYCASPPSTGVCCGICPNSGISGLGGHVSLLFSTLASPIAMAPQSAPTSLISSLIQANAYAVTLLGYLLSDASGLDFFHASYALMLAFSSLIPLAAIAASPPWAITGQKSPEERKEEAQRMVLDVVQELDDSESSDDDDERRHLRRRRKKRRAKLIRIINEDPGLVLDLGRSVGPCGIPSSHWMLYIGFFVSVVLWGFVLYLGVLGGATGSTRIALSQPNCTAGLGNVAALMVYANIAFMFIGIAIFVATIVNHLMHDVAGALNRQVELEYSGSPKLVFGVAFTIWLLWFGVSFSLYFAAGNANLLSAGEFSWGFGSVFSALMILVPGYSIIKTLLSLR
ncbi:hypothetical protein NBRC10513v2_003552 [Rhodotorula toruloides]